MAGLRRAKEEEGWTGGGKGDRDEEDEGEEKNADSALKPLVGQWSLRRDGIKLF